MCSTEAAASALTKHGYYNMLIVGTAYVVLGMLQHTQTQLCSGAIREKIESRFPRGATAVLAFHSVLREF